jgi:hypothetical protein
MEGIVTICAPTIVGLGEARTFACPTCRRWRRFWLQSTMDGWYDSEWFWRCDTCGGSPRLPRYNGPEPLLWKFHVRALVERIKDGTA